MKSRSFRLAATVTAILVVGGVAAMARGAQAPATPAPSPAGASSPAGQASPAVQPAPAGQSSPSPQPPGPPRRPAPPAPTGPRPPAASLAAPTSAARPPDAAGFIRRWLVLEPIPVPPQLGETAVQALVKDARFSQLAAMPAAGQKVTIGDHALAWHAVDTLGYNVNLFHFAYALGKPTSNVLFWTTTVVEAPRELTGLRLAIGSNAASVWWLNGEEVIGIYNDRQAVIDDGVSKRITLKPGRNVIRAAIVNGGGATDFCARFIDENGNPVKGFTTRVTAEGAAR